MTFGLHNPISVFAISTIFVNNLNDRCRYSIFALMRKGISYRTLCLFISCSIAALASHGQILPNFGGQRAGLSALSFLKNDMSPRSMGLGGASVALSGDAFSVASNPAALTHLNEGAIGASHLLLGAGIQQSLLSLQKKLPNAATIGLSINSLNSGQMEIRTEFQPEGTGNYFSVGQNAFGLNYAQKLSDMFNLGMTMKYINEQMAGYSNHVLAFDVGFLYETDFNDLKFAVLVQNFGGNSAISGSEVPVSYNRKGEIKLSRYTVPTVFKMGLAFTAFEADKKKLTIAAELNNPNDNAENIRLGGEFSYSDFLRIQSGIKLSVKGQILPSFGFQYKTRLGVHPLHLGYAMNPTNYMGNQHLISVQWQRNKMERS
jgi:hypothetical protein